MISLIPSNQHILIWCILLAVSLFGMYGERVGWFRKISGALMTILAAAILTTLKVIPDAANSEIDVPVYDLVFGYFIPFAIPLLLFNVQLKKMIRDTGTLLLPFLIGAVGVVIGAFIAAYLLNLGEETYKVAGTFVGTYTGGSVNFMGVAMILDFLESPLFPSTITVDNVFTNLYIILLFMLPGIQWIAKWFPDYDETNRDNVESFRDTAADENESVSLMESMTICLLITAGIFALGTFLGPLLARALSTEIHLDILIITALIIVFVNIFPDFFQKYQAIAFDIGMFFMYMFLAVIGASSNLMELFGSVPGILVFAAITLTIHLLFTLAASKMLGISLKEAMVASCANAGGPSVAAPMAISFGMKKAVTPAILIGLLGYVIGTFLGSGVGRVLLWVAEL